MGSHRDPALLPDLVRFAEAPEADVRLAATRALADLSTVADPARDQALLTLMADPDTRTRQAARDALATYLQNPSLAGPLVAALRALLDRDHTAVRRLAAVELLAPVRDPTLDDLFLDLCRTETVGEVRRAAVAALARRGVSRAWDQLQAMRTRDLDQDVRLEAERALSLLPRPSDIPVVAVASFRNSGMDPALDSFCTELVRVISAQLSSAQLARVVERERIDVAVQELRLGAGGAVDENTAPEIGRFLGARQIVFGTVTRHASDVTIVVQRLDVETGELVQGITVNGYVYDLATLAQDVATRFAASF
jgi:HEAT repeat protein